MRLALDLPKLMTLLPPPCIWFIRKMKKTTMRRMGARVPSSVTHTELFWMSVLNSTSFARRYSSMLQAAVNPTWKGCPSLSSP